MTAAPLLPDARASAGATAGAVGVYCHAASAVATDGANGVYRCPVALDIFLFRRAGLLAKRAEDHHVEHFLLALGDGLAVAAQAGEELRNLCVGGSVRHGFFP